MATNSPTSAGHLYELIRRGQARTRREMREVTDLARSTVMQRVDLLVAAGLVREEGVERVGVGRPTAILTAVDDLPTILVADLGATHGRLAVTDAGGRLLAERTMPSAIGSGPERVLDRVASRFDKMLAGVGRSVASLCGIGIGLPGPIDYASKRVVHAPLMPGWHEFDIAGHLHRRYRAPVHVDNDANLMALGEHSRHHADVHALAFVKVGTGIGCGVVIDGVVLRGSHGAEGDIGHVRLAGNDAVCRCGAVGCLASVASGGAIAAQLRSRDPDVSVSADVIRLLDAGDADAVQAVGRAGAAIGEVLATVVALVNPDVLVLGGDLGVSPHLLRAVHERLLQRTQALATRHLAVVSSRLGDRAGIAGAVETVRRHEFSAEAIDERLSLRGRGTP